VGCERCRAQLDSFAEEYLGWNSAKLSFAQCISNRAQLGGRGGLYFFMKDLVDASSWVASRVDRPSSSRPCSSILFKIV
jgi:hypothetical protein